MFQCLEDFHYHAMFCKAIKLAVCQGFGVWQYRFANLSRILLAIRQLCMIKLMLNEYKEMIRTLDAPLIFTS